MSALHLLRHGAHGDVGRRLTGRLPDSGLTGEGRRQVEKAVAALAGTPPTAIHASPRRRTQETAAILACAFDLPVTTSTALDEIDFGTWSGRSFAELEREPRWQEWNNHRASVRCPGGETMGEAQTRALAYAFEAAALSERSVLVTHCDIIRALHCWADRAPLDSIHDLDCPPGQLSRLDLLAAQQVAA